ncbi:MAG: PAS domain S-box protein, partial [Cyanobacteria bacterium P01_D01_bin.115]
MHGYTYEEFMQLSPPDYVHPDSFPAFGQFTEAIRAGQKFTCEAVDFHKDGTLIPIEVTGVPFCYGNRLCALAVVRDISEKKRHDAERKAAAAELDKQAQFLRSTYEGVDHSIIIIDVTPEGEFLFVDWNPAIESRTGINRSDIVGKNPEELLGHEQGTRIRRQYQKCVAAGATITYEEFIPFQGQDHWWLTTLNPLKDQQDRVYRIVLTTFDITKQKLTESALQQQEHQYRSIFESINDGIFIIDLGTGQTLSVNPAVCKMHGYSYEEFLQLSPSDYVHPNSLPIFTQFIETIQAGKKFMCEATDLHKDGTLIPIEVIGVPFNYNNNPCVLSVVRDISDRKAAEAELDKQAQFLRSTYEGVDHSIIIIDVTPEGEFLFVDWNPAIESRTGIDRSDIVGKNPEELLGHEQGTRIRRQYQKCVAAGATITYEEFIPFQGQDHWWLTTLNPLKDQQDRVYRIVLTTFDITKQKLTESALQQQEHQYRSIFESINDGIFIRDLETGSLITVNPTTCKMHGYTYEEFMQLDLADYIHPDSLPRFADFVEAVRAGNRFFGEAVGIHKDGTPIYIEVVGTPFAYGGEPHALAVVRDISDRKRLEAEQQEAEAELKDTNSFLNSVLEAIPGFFYANDLDGKYIALNSNVADLFKCSVAEVIGKTDLDFFPAETAKLVMEHDREVMAQGELQRFEEEIPISPTETAICLSTKAPLRNAAGEMVGIIGLSQDISDRKAMEVSLRESEQRFRDVTEAAGEYIWEMTPDCRYTFVTEQAKIVKGYGPDALLGHSPFEFMCPQDIPQATAIIEAAAKNKSIFQLEHRDILASGEVVWESVSGVPILNNSDEIIGFRGTGLSITERKLAEFRVAESEAKFRRLVENADDLIYTVDADYCFTYLSPQFTEMWGHAVQAFINQSFMSLIYPHDLPIAVESVQTLFGTGERPTEIELRALHKDGTHFWMICSNIPIKNEQGQVIGWQGTARDISERKAFEEAQSRLTAILNATTDFVGMANMRGEQIYMNQAGRRMLEIPEDVEIIGQPLDHHIPEQAKSIVLTEGIPTAICDGTWQGEAALQTYAGREFPVSQVIIAHKGEDGQPKYLSTVVRDITAQKQSEAALQQKAKELQTTLKELQLTQLQMIQSEKMSSLGQLVAGVAHEINNPVNFIYANIAPMSEYTHDLLDLVELYQQEYPAPTLAIQERIQNMDLQFVKEDSPKILTSMHVGTERIRQIVGSLKNFSRLDEAECKEADIHAGIDSTLLILENRIKATSERPDIQIERDYGALPLVKCYPGQLNQVFMNILANALDALDQCEHERSFKEIQQHPNVIKIQTRLVSTDRVLIRIADNGPGIPEHIQQRIFDPFFTTKPVGKGTGIGMSISHQIITEKHGGTISCQSGAGEGAQFTIEIPY